MFKNSLSNSYLDVPHVLLMQAGNAMFIGAAELENIILMNVGMLVEMVTTLMTNNVTMVTLMTMMAATRGATLNPGTAAIMF